VIGSKIFAENLPYASLGKCQIYTLHMGCMEAVMFLCIYTELQYRNENKGVASSFLTAKTEGSSLFLTYSEE